jgi:hypothetical protein
MREAKDIRIKQAFTELTKVFRMSAIKGTYLHESLASYYYIQKWQPELLKDPSWVAKKLRFDKDMENNLVAFRYYIDTGLGAEHVLNHEHLAAAIAKFIPTKWPEMTGTIANTKHEALLKPHNGWTHVFGTREERLNHYQFPSEFVLLRDCNTIEEYFKHLLPRKLRNQTTDAAHDMIRLPGKADMYTQ